MWLYVLRRRCSTFQTFDCIPFLSLLLLILPTIIITIITIIVIIVKLSPFMLIETPPLKFLKPVSQTLNSKLDRWWYDGDTNHGMNFKSRTEKWLSRWWWQSLFMMMVWLWSKQLYRKSWWWQCWLWWRWWWWQWWCLRLSSWQSLSVKLMKSQIFAAHWTKLPCNYTVQKSVHNAIHNALQSQCTKSAH